MRNFSYYEWQEIFTNFPDINAFQITNPYGGNYSSSSGGAGNFSTNPNANSSSQDNSRKFDEQDKCGGLAKMAALSTASGLGSSSKEVFAVLTAEGKLIIFPTNGNSSINARIPGIFEVRPSIDPVTNTVTGNQVDYAYKSATERIVIQNVVATYHTHPLCITDGCSGDLPSAEGSNQNGSDESVARALPRELQHYVLGCCGTHSFRIDPYNNFQTQQSSQYIDDMGDRFQVRDAESYERKTGNACP